MNNEEGDKENYDFFENLEYLTEEENELEELFFELDHNPKFFSYDYNEYKNRKVIYDITDFYEDLYDLLDY